MRRPCLFAVLAVLLSVTACSRRDVVKKTNRYGGKTEAVRYGRYSAKAKEGLALVYHHYDETGTIRQRDFVPTEEHRHKRGILRRIVFYSKKGTRSRMVVRYTQPAVKKFGKARTVHNYGDNGRLRYSDEFYSDSFARRNGIKRLRTAYRQGRVVYSDGFFTEATRKQEGAVRVRSYFNQEGERERQVFVDEEGETVRVEHYRSD